MLDFEDISMVHLVNDNLQDFQNKWESTLQGLRERPNDRILEWLYRKQVGECQHFKMILQLYDQDVHFNGHEASYQRLFSMVNLHLEKRRKEKNRRDMQHRHDALEQEHRL